MVCACGLTPAPEWPVLMSHRIVDTVLFLRLPRGALMEDRGGAMLRGKDRRLAELKAVLEFWRSLTRQHPELEDRVFREVLWNHLHGEVSTQIGVSRVTGIARATVL